MNTTFTKLHEVIENYKAAVYEKDVEKFVSAYSPNVHIYDCWDDWECTGVSQWKESVNQWFNGLKEEGVLLKTEFSDLVVEEKSDLAFVHSNVTYAAYNDSGEKLRQLSNRFTFGLKKENESWHIIHEHSSLPISTESGKGIFHLK